MSQSAAAREERRPEVTVGNPLRYPGLGATGLGLWLREVVADIAPRAGSLALRLTSDREVRRLNARYRGKDRATDVLSFPGGEDGEEHHLGDVAIAVPMARRQAETAGHDLARELRELALHGVLHCLGHDHETDGGTMDRLELELRRRWIDHD